MLSALKSYGPDRQLFWSGRGIALGGNFSDLLPEDRFDAQPLWSGERPTCLVADVRLDNRAELARDLHLVHPEELPDSAFLMAAWLRWGADCLDHLLGSFAFAVWMPDRQEIFAARDHAGQRPLFYHRGNGIFALASMPKGLLALPGLGRGFQEPGIARWLAALSPDWSATFFEGIQRVPPGHFLRATPHTFECKQYWHPSHVRPTRYKRDEEYAEALLDILDRATDACLRSTKPVGSFLSSGLDSSSVTASAAILLAAQGKKLTAFTAVPRPEFNGIAQPGQIPSEGNAAAEIARLYPNVEHRLVDSRGYHLLATMKTWTDAMDEPAANVINLLWIAAILNQANQQGIGVMLEGTGGNATLSWSSWSILGHFFQCGQWARLARTTSQLHSRGALSFKTAARYATRSLVPGWLVHQLISDRKLVGQYDSLAHPRLKTRYNLDSRIFDSIYRTPTDLLSERSAIFEYFDSGPLNAAVQALTNTELRDPTGDRRLYDFCFSIPPEQFLAGGHSRSLARRAMKGRLPEATLMQYARGDQGADWYLTMTESLPELRREIPLIAESPLATQSLDLPAMQALIDTWPKSNFHLDPVFYRWNYWLLRAISMGSFLRSHDPAISRGADQASDAPTAAPLK